MSLFTDNKRKCVVLILQSSFDACTVVLKIEAWESNLTKLKILCHCSDCKQLCELSDNVVVVA